MDLHLYVPAAYSFQRYFLPRVKNPNLECFEVNRNRLGIQRKGNNHLVVFLDFHSKKAPAHYLGEGGREDFRLSRPEDTELFNGILGPEPEAAAYNLSYHPRMSVIAWKLLLDIADEEKVLVEDGLVGLMRGADYARDLRLFMDPDGLEPAAP